MIKDIGYPYLPYANSFSLNDTKLVIKGVHGYGVNIPQDKKEG